MPAEYSAGTQLKEKKTEWCESVQQALEHCIYIHVCLYFTFVCFPNYVWVKGHQQFGGRISRYARPLITSCERVRLDRSNAFCFGERANAFPRTLKRVSSNAQTRFVERANAFPRTLKRVLLNAQTRFLERANAFW